MSKTATLGALSEGKPAEVATPSAIWRIPSMMTCRFLAEKARVVNSSLTESGVMLRRVPHWVGYPRADLFLEHFERLFRHPARTRMPCALLYGDSGIGMTMILEKFARAHRPIYDDKLGQEVRPVLLAQMPSGPDEPRLYASLLTESSPGQ